MAEATAKSNVQVLQDGYNAFNEGDFESVLALMDENIEWIEPEGLPFGGSHHGPEAVAENVFGPVMEPFESLELDVDRFIDGSDTIVVLDHFYSIGCIPQITPLAAATTTLPTGLNRNLSLLRSR